MNLLLEIVVKSDFLLDLFGVIGLGLLGLAALRLSARSGSKGGRVMSFGALALIIGRLATILMPQFVSPHAMAHLNPLVSGLLTTVPVILLTVGLAAVVWGLWGHEQESSGQSHPV